MAGGPAAVTGVWGVEAIGEVRSPLEPIALFSETDFLRTGCAELARKPLGLLPGLGVLVFFVSEVILS